MAAQRMTTAVVRLGEPLPLSPPPHFSTSDSAAPPNPASDALDGRPIGSIGSPSEKKRVGEWVREGAKGGGEGEDWGGGEPEEGGGRRGDVGSYPRGEAEAWQVSR